MTRDIESFGLKHCKVSSGEKENLEKELDYEFRNYNADILYSNNDIIDITVMEAIDKKGNKVVLYYYPYLNYRDRSLEHIMRQIRTFDKDGNIVSMTRAGLEGNGEYRDIDSGSVVYQYDRNGNKKLALYEDDIEGVVYYEYDKNGKVKLSIANDHIHQIIRDGEKEYSICDGYFKPGENGFTYIPYESMYDIEETDIKRYVFGDVSREEKENIQNSLTYERQEEILGILRLMEPIFEYAWTYDKLDTQKREKIISWFKGFSKELEIDSKLNSVSSKDDQLKGCIAQSKKLDEQIGDAEDLLAEYQKETMTLETK